MEKQEHIDTDSDTPNNKKRKRDGFGDLIIGLTEANTNSSTKQQKFTQNETIDDRDATYDLAIIEIDGENMNKKFSSIPVVYDTEYNSLAAVLVKNLNLECPICFDIIPNKALKCTNCPSIFCPPCIGTVTTTSTCKKCPTCKKDNIKDFISLSMENALLCLPRKCPACGISFNCNEALMNHLSGKESTDNIICKIGKLCSACDTLISNNTQHLCPCDIIECPNVHLGCYRKDVIRSLLKAHLFRCDYEYKKCSGWMCMYKDLAINIKKHEAGCMYAINDALKDRIKVLESEVVLYRRFIILNDKSQLPVGMPIPKIDYTSKYRIDTERGCFNIGFKDSEGGIFFRSGEKMNIILDWKQKLMALQSPHTYISQIEIIINLSDFLIRKKQASTIVLSVDYHSVDKDVIFWNKLTNQFIPIVGFACGYKTLNPPLKINITLTDENERSNLWRWIEEAGRAINNV